MEDWDDMEIQDEYQELYYRICKQERETRLKKKYIVFIVVKIVFSRQIDGSLIISL